MSQYFVTGATGVVGSAIVRELLALQPQRLVLLIRASDAPGLQRRLATLLDFLGHDGATPPAAIEALRGDTELPNFGLPQRDYEALCASTSHIIHSAASVRMNLPLEAARRSAVTACNNILDLACHCQRLGVLHKLDLVSTVGVGGRLPGPLPEHWITEARQFHNSYEQAKAEAEVVIRRRIEEGLPATVHRPSMVVGESRSGRIPHFQIFYHLCEFLCGRRTRGWVPALGRGCLDLVPVDYVARSIVWASGNASSAGQVLHLCAGPAGALPLEALRTIVSATFRRYGVAVPRSHKLPVAWLKAFARLCNRYAPEHWRLQLAALPVLLEYLAEEQSFANSRSRIFLQAAGIALPRVQDFLPPVLDHYLRHRHSVSI